MGEELVRVASGKKSVTIVKECYTGTDRLTFMFCSNGYQSTGVTLSKEEIEMLRTALDLLKTTM